MSTFLVRYAELQLYASDQDADSLRWVSIQSNSYWNEVFLKINNSHPSKN